MNKKINHIKEKEKGTINAQAKECARVWFAYEPGEGRILPRQKPRVKSFSHPSGKKERK